MGTNLKILFTVVGTLAVYTAVANVIPQVQSAVPEELELSADATPAELVAAGEEIFTGIGGCTACHGLGTRAPDLLGVAGTVCETRVPDQSCKEYLWSSLTDPMAYVVDGFQPIMLDQSRLLTEAQLWALVAFLQDQGGTVTVGPDDFAAALAAESAAETEPADIVPEEADPGQIDPTALITATGCLACHALDGQGGQVAPPFEQMRDLDAEYIRRSIVSPNADTAAGYEAFAGTMPPTFEQMLSQAELDALVAFIAGEGPPPPDGDGGTAGDDGGDDEEEDSGSSEADPEGGGDSP